MRHKDLGNTFCATPLEGRSLYVKPPSGLPGTTEDTIWVIKKYDSTRIIYSQTLTESEDGVQIGDHEVGEKGSSDDEPNDSPLASVKRIPRRSLFKVEMTMPLSRPHNTPEKNALVPDMTDDNLESCMTKTQKLIQDTINNLF